MTFEDIMNEIKQITYNFTKSEIFEKKYRATINISKVQKLFDIIVSLCLNNNSKIEYKAVKKESVTGFGMLFEIEGLCSGIILFTKLNSVYIRIGEIGHFGERYEDLLGMGITVEDDEGKRAYVSPIELAKNTIDNHRLYYRLLGVNREYF